VNKQNSNDIILISGPTGGGKSTFLKSMASGNLDDEILHALPEGAADWPIIEANDILKGDISLRNSVERIEADGRVRLHYDIMFIWSRGLNSYEEDPSLKILEHADRLWIVFLKPDQSTVKRQYHDRRVEQMKRQSAASRWWGRWARGPIRRLKHKVNLDPRKDLGDIYMDEKLLSHSYDQWHKYIQTMRNRLPNLQIMTVTPLASVDGNPKFSILK